MKVTVHAPMSLQRYPYDRHVVPFCVGTRATKDAYGTLTKWELSKEWPEWAPATYDEDNNRMNGAAPLKKHKQTQKPRTAKTSSDR